MRTSAPWSPFEIILFLAVLVGLAVLAIGLLPAPKIGPSQQPQQAIEQSASITAESRPQVEAPVRNEPQIIEHEQLLAFIEELKTENPVWKGRVEYPGRPGVLNGAVVNIVSVKRAPGELELVSEPSWSDRVQYPDDMKVTALQFVGHLHRRFPEQSVRVVLTRRIDQELSEVIGTAAYDSKTDQRTFRWGRR